MTEKDLKTNIKNTRDFIDLWGKFHDLFQSASRREAITREEENLFLETKSLVADKYTSLKGFLKPYLAADEGTMDVIADVLSLKGMTTISDDALRRIEQNWDHSRDVLNRISKQLEAEGYAASRAKRLKRAAQRIASLRIVQIVILVLLIFVMFCGVNIVIGLFVK